MTGHFRRNLYQAIAIANTRQTFVTFAAMKGHFKIFLLILITCCYANTVFEFSDNEKKTNFENESHCYIQQDNSNLNYTYTKIVKQLDNDIISWHSVITSPIASNDTYSFAETKNFSPPPERLYLCYSVLLI